MKKLLLLLLFILQFTDGYAQKFEGLAETPAMGWNTWNRFGCDVNEELIRGAADAMVESGMKDAGYEYIVIDDCWHGERDNKGFIQADKERFPSGMKALVDYIHSKGLKFGIYSDAGGTTCAGEPGSRGHEYQDAITYARWGVDYLKYDWCDTENINPISAYTTMRDALYEAGRPVLFAICEWGQREPWKWAQDVGHMWRTTGDIYHCWDCEKDYGDYSSWGVLRILDLQKSIRQYAGPGHWNDPDMMEVGNGMEVSEDRAHFTMWSMLAAPLIAGNDIQNMTDETRKILTHKEMIAINQDSLGRQAWKYSESNGLETWFKPLSNGNWAVTFLNRAEEERTVNFNWNENTVIDPDFGHEADFQNTIYTVKDIWKDKALRDTRTAVKASIPPHDVLTLRLNRK